MFCFVFFLSSAFNKVLGAEVLGLFPYLHSSFRFLNNLENEKVKSLTAIQREFSG